MKYRPFGSTGWSASALGFGCMRLPTRGTPQDIDEQLAIRMIRHAIDSGVNYVDTAYPYHGKMSEVVVGKALRDGYRARTKLATKLPVWLVNTREDCDRIFDEQLAKLQTDHVDLYLLHSLGKATWDKVGSLGIIAMGGPAEGASGRIGWIGFSFHDEYPVFQQIMDGWDAWDFCQIQYNYMNTDVQAGTKGLKLRCGPRDGGRDHGAAPRGRSFQPAAGHQQPVEERPRRAAPPRTGRCSGSGTSPRWASSSAA